MNNLFRIWLEMFKHIRRICLSINIGKLMWLYIITNRSNPLFTSVEVETSSICNRKCAYCPNSSYQRVQSHLMDAFFYKIINELSEIDFSGRLSPHFYGEPLLDIRLTEFMAYARKRLPKAYIQLFTNGDFLTYKLFQELLEAGVDSFRIAQHSESPSEILTATLRMLDDETRTSRIEVINFFASKQPLMNRGGLIEIETNQKWKHCDYVSGLTIDYEGNLLLCCQDYLSKYKFGNIATERLQDIWDKAKYKLLRDKIQCGIWPLDICKECNKSLQDS